MPCHDALPCACEAVLNSNLFVTLPGSIRSQHNTQVVHIEKAPETSDEQSRQQRFVITPRFLHQHTVSQFVQALLSLRVDQHIRFCGCPRGRLAADTIQWHTSPARVQVR
jgi:hypothetical protein